MVTWNPGRSPFPDGDLVTFETHFHVAWNGDFDYSTPGPESPEIIAIARAS